MLDISVHFKQVNLFNRLFIYSTCIGVDLVIAMIIGKSRRTLIHNFIYYAFIVSRVQSEKKRPENSYRYNWNFDHNVSIRLQKYSIFCIPLSCICNLLFPKITATDRSLIFLQIDNKQTIENRKLKICNRYKTLERAIRFYLAEDYRYVAIL